MGQITPAALNAIYLNFDQRFQSAYDTAPTIWQNVATESPSSARDQTYPLMAKLPKMREWLGERQIQNLASHAYTISNKDYELTVEVDRNDILDDRIGVYGPVVDMMGIQTRKQPDDLIVALLQNGHVSTSLCYDGQPFFSTSHPQNKFDASSPVQSNYSASGLALNEANYDTARSRMRAFKGEDGRPLGVGRRFMLAVPPALEGVGKRILTAEWIPSAAGTASQTNIYRGTAELLVVPELAGQDTTWYLLDVGMPVKPLIFQNRQPPQLVRFENPDNPEVFKRKKFTYGVDVRNNAGYALWFLAYKAAA